MFFFYGFFHGDFIVMACVDLVIINGALQLQYKYCKMHNPLSRSFYRCEICTVVA
jgi:hypothetical protein